MRFQTKSISPNNWAEPDDDAAKLFAIGSKRRREFEEHDESDVIADKFTYGDIRRASSGRMKGQALFQTVRHSGAINCLEIGTCIGISSLYIVGALALNARDGDEYGFYLGLDGYAFKLREAQKSIDAVPHRNRINVELIEGKFDDTLADALAIFKRHGVRLEIVFLDGNHHEGPTKRYFGMCVEAMPLGGLIIMDDTTWSQGMRRATTSIERLPRVRRMIELPGAGSAMLCQIVPAQEGKG